MKFEDLKGIGRLTNLQTLTTSFMLPDATRDPVFGDLTKLQTLVVPKLIVEYPCMINMDFNLFNYFSFADDMQQLAYLVNLKSLTLKKVHNYDYKEFLYQVTSLQNLEYLKYELL